MGYIKHHAIAVTSWDEIITKAHEEAVRIFGHLVTPIIDSGMNSYQSFFIAPDGSKEGWELSNEGDHNREEFIKFLKAECEYASYCEFYYGEDNGRSEIENHN